MAASLQHHLPGHQAAALTSMVRQRLRRQPPPMGSVVTYRFNGTHASGLPRFARFWRVRADEPRE